MLKITVLTDELKKNCREFYEYAWAVANENRWKCYLHNNNLLQDDTNGVVYYKENDYTFAVNYFQDTYTSYDMGNVIDVIKGDKYIGSYNITSGRVFLSPKNEQFVKELQA